MTGPAEAVLALRRVIVAGRDLDLGSKKGENNLHIYTIAFSYVGRHSETVRKLELLWSNFVDTSSSSLSCFNSHAFKYFS